MDFLIALAEPAVTAAIALLWARWSKLELGFSAPAVRRAEPWVLLYILWRTAEWAIPILFPTAVDPNWAHWTEQFTLAEQLILLVLLAPIAEELLFRGAMFAALLRRWGIWTAALVPSLIWCLLHVPPEWWYATWLVGSGFLLSMVRWRSGSLYLPIALHAAWNLLVTLHNNELFGPVAN